MEGPLEYRCPKGENPLYQLFWVNLIYVFLWSVWLNRVCSFRYGLRDVKNLFALHELDVEVIYDR